jgi:hypothetical protein
VKAVDMANDDYLKWLEQVKAKNLQAENKAEARKQIDRDLRKQIGKTLNKLNGTPGKE